MSSSRRGQRTYNHEDFPDMNNNNLSFHVSFDEAAVDDEALARALQEEYEIEYYRRQERSSNSRISSSNSSSSSSSRNNTSVLRGVPVQPSAPMMMEGHRAQAQQQQRPSNSSNNNNNSHRYSANCATPLTSRSSSLGSGTTGGTTTTTTTATTTTPSSVAAIPVIGFLYDDNDDEEVARRMQQELSDEELARAITQREQQLVSQQAAAAAAAAAAAEPPYSHRHRSCLRRFLCRFVPLAVAGAAVGFMVYYFVYGGDSLPDWIPSPEEFANEDPFAQQDPDDASRWRNRGNGLDMVIVNALDSEWDGYFYTAVNDWDSGQPDTLTLSTEKVNPDPACSSIDGVIKICNGNYGETYWRGINKLLLEGNTIYASAARMNEFYFRSGKDEAQRQYTMCHEMGHGFGLPHTDESFTNPDLGNCMDYTNRPQNNMHPDTMNFDFLFELYGAVPGSEVESQSSVFGNEEDSTTTTTTQEEEEDSTPKEKKKGGGKRNLLRSQQQRVRVPHRVLRSLEEVDNEIDQGISALTPENGWKLLHQTEHGEAYEKPLDVDESFRVQVHFLLAVAAR